MSVNQVKVVEGRVLFKHETLPENCETWYQVHGNLKSSSTGRPLVLLHGGPGATHNYLKPLSELAVKHGVTVVFYDQLGCGNSTRLREKRLDTDFWTVDLFMAEFDNLVEHLGISESFDLLGQSWGGMLLASIAIRGHKGLKKIVIANSPASLGLWLEGCNMWRKQLPDEVEIVLQKNEEDKTYENPEYLKAVTFFYERHMCRVVPYPPPVAETMANMEEDSTVYFTMNGPSEFTVVGSLKSFDVTSGIHKIVNPALVINAEYDCATDSAIQPFVKGIKGAKWHKFSGCSHMPHVEKQDEYVDLVAAFLKE